MVNYTLKGARIQKAMTQEDMAETLNITPQTYCRKECGKTPFISSEIESIGIVLQLSANELCEVFFPNFFSSLLNTKSKSA